MAVRNLSIRQVSRSSSSKHRNRLASLFLFLLILSSLIAKPAHAQRGEGPLVDRPPVGITVEEIVAKFAQREKEFQAARARYTYHQSNIIQTLEGNRVDGEYRQDWDINFDNQARRTISVTYAPAPTLTRVSLTGEDTNDLQNVMPFVLTTDEIPDYNLHIPRSAARRRAQNLRF